MAGSTIPVYVNPAAGSAKAALAALDEHSGFDVRLTPPERLAVALRQAVSAGEPRVLVAGGDGTIASAAAILTGSDTALAVLPGGTLNHFARSHGIPADLEDALKVATGGRETRVDVGYVNERLFLNTSSVGAYVRFVETRDRLERHLGYWAASLVAGLRMIGSVRSSRVTVEVEGERRDYIAPLAFIAVGERILVPPKLGQPVGKPGGALHVVIPRGRRQARRFARAYSRMDRGMSAEKQALGLDSALVDRLRLDLSRPTVKVAVDGEIVRQRTPLEYRLERGALSLVVPREEGEGMGSAGE
ncbi:MAG TPA: diacylglycerol kinase family protein [Gemmatimonadales bacterium]|nr:diacylglycerol kinase family protein [Gemmatimonadales bacterium]